MKIIQINCVYKRGSTGKIVYDLHSSAVENGGESIALYGRGKRVKEENVYKVSSELEAKIHSFQSKTDGVEFSHSAIATARIIKIIRNENPDVVHLHCLNGHFVNVYKLLNFLKSSKIPTVLTLHAEIMHTAGCEHALECNKWEHLCHDCNKIKGAVSRYFRDDAKHCFELMQRTMSGFDNLAVVGVSEWLTNRAKKSGIFSGFAGRFQTVKNGIDETVFCKRSDFNVREKYKIDKRPIVLHVTSDFNHHLKGGKYVLEIAKLLPEYNFIIIGKNAPVDLLPGNVLTIQRTDNQAELAQIYTDADVTLLTSRKETFSMICAESLCCGTPVVGFEAGAPETIAIKEYSEFVPQGETEALAKAVKNMIDRHPEIDTDLAVKTYSAETMWDNYYALYKEIMHTAEHSEK